jgi:YegS/Rv2252/BmrU family lipid kinase
MLRAMSGTVLVVNPRSAGGKTASAWPRLSEIIREAYGEFEARLTASPGDATDLTREALRLGADTVVAVGGDGTINEVVNGFFDGDEPVRPGAAFAVLPAGTGGDFVKTLGVPRDLARAASSLKDAPPRAIDVGRVRFTAADGSDAARYFINIASFGISGLVDRYVNQSSKALGGRLSFAVATLRAGLAYQNAEVRLTLDGATREGRIYNVAIANGRYCGGGMKVAPHAELGDGLFDVVTMGDMGLSDLLLRGTEIYSGKHLSNPKVSVARARRVDAEPIGDNGREVLLDVDGEQPGRLPASFELLPGGLRVRAQATA